MTNKWVLTILLVFTALLTSCSEIGIQQMDELNLVKVTAQEFKTLIDSKNDPGVILDIRTIDEFNQGHIEGAIILDYYSPTFRSNLALLGKSPTYYMYCRSGHRSGNTLIVMEALGFKKVYELESGINEWKELNYSTKKK